MRLAIIGALLLAGCSQQQEQAAPEGTTASCEGAAKSELVWIPGGSFTMGENPRYREEGPPRTVHVDGFWMDSHEITNAEFAAFVKATDYQTIAERDPPKIDGAPPEMLVPGSAVFNVPSGTDRRWWRWEVGAQWRNPSRPDENITGKGRVPVVQIAYDDALAYAKWAGKELPSEEQWEYAARGGEEVLPEPKDADGNPQANYYQGVFPAKDLGEDGFETRAPVEARLLGISKRGDIYLRTLLIHGGRSVLRFVDRKQDRRSQWAKELIQRRNRNVAAVAMANKMVRTAYALLKHDTVYCTDRTMMAA